MYKRQINECKESAGFIVANLSFVYSGCNGLGTGITFLSGVEKGDTSLSLSLVLSFESVENDVPAKLASLFWLILRILDGCCVKGIVAVRPFPLFIRCSYNCLSSFVKKENDGHFKSSTELKFRTGTFFSPLLRLEIS